MLLAPKLKKGDTIAIVNSSNKFKPHHKEELMRATEWFREQGFEVMHGKHLESVDKDGISAGSVEERVEDINNVIRDQNVKAIWFFQGGLAASELLSSIDYDTLQKNPKIILGMSDPDNFHLAFNAKISLVTFTSCDPKIRQGQHLTIPHTQKMFTERLVEGKLGLIQPSGERVTVRSGTAQGKLVGCNMTVLAGLMGTPYLPDFNGAILCLDTFYSDTRSLRWKLSQLKLAGVFDKLAGILVGHQEGFNENVDYTTPFEETLLELTQENDFPILKIEDFGHRSPNAFLPLGAQVKIDADAKTVELVEAYLTD